MPVITELQQIRTKVLGVTEEDRQGMLLAIYNKPEIVLQICLDNNHVIAILEIDERMIKTDLGTIKSKYYPLTEGKYLKIKQWSINGGRVMPEYNNRCQPLGMNITIHY